MDTERAIILYNELTKLDNVENENNFLESIEYKMEFGNVLLENLLILENNNIEFEVVEGYIDKSYYSIPLFNTFEACTLKFKNDVDIDYLYSILKNVAIEKHTSKNNILYLFVEKGEAV